MLPIIKRAATIIGDGLPNYSALAEAIGAHRSAFYVWKAVPEQYCPKIVKATDNKITLSQIRPDLYT